VYTKILACLLLLLFGSGTATATTWMVDVGGQTTGDSDGYGGYNMNPVLAFGPTPLTINAGDSVTFRNLGGAAHNVHADDNSFRCASGCDDSGGNGSPSSASWSFTRTFHTPGTIGYHCDVHASMGMTGSIIVNATAPAIALGGYLSGNWFIPAQGGGQGFQLEFTNAVSATSGKPQMLAIWFVYTPAGSTANDGSGQNWIYAQGDFDPADDTVTLAAVLLSGARFPPNFNASDVHWAPADGTLWGHLTFAFSGCNAGTVSWHSDLPGYNAANDTPQAIQRLTQIAGTTCP